MPIPFGTSLPDLPRGNLIIPGTGGGAVVCVCPRQQFTVPRPEVPMLSTSRF